MSNLWRKLDNTAKAFSLEEKDNINTFRLSVILKNKVDLKILKFAVNKTLDIYPSFKVRLRSGFFWNYLENNDKEVVIVEESEMPCKNINFRENNDYLFKVTYFNNKINLDVIHILTDGVGASIFLKEILYQYLDLKYHLKRGNKELLKQSMVIKDENLANASMKIVCREYYKKAFLIEEKSNLLYNKTYHYILDLNKFKSICKNKNVSITEYLIAIYILAIYNSIYDNKSNRDIGISVPVDLRKYYDVKTLSNFFTCMNIYGNILNKERLFLDEVIKEVHKEFMNKKTSENIKSYLARDVRLGTNIGLRLVPLVGKKLFMKCFGRLVSQSTTTTLSNIGIIEIDERYKKYIDNILVLVSAGKIQKVKCTICSYENKLTVTINSNLITNSLEEEFYRLLKMYVGNIRLESNCN